MNKSKKVIIFLHQIRHYRVPIFRIISAKYDITLVTKIKEQCNLYKNERFKVIYIPTVKVGPFVVHKKNIHKLVKHYDVAIGLMNLRTIDIVLLAFNPFIKTKIIFWGIGVSASYNKQFDSDKRFDFLRFWIFKKADALLFYTQYPVEKYVLHGFDNKSLFIANNTIEVNNDSTKALKQLRKNFLFIGTLYRQKGLGELLYAYKKAFSIVGADLNKLIIIGDGEEKDFIEQYIIENNLTNKIILKGFVYDQDLLKDYFYSSLLCISPKQAGLSVLMSMGYSVCFVTKNNAITGGELYNITNNKTGIVYNKDDELHKIIIDAYYNPAKYSIIGTNAKNYYLRNRLPKQMANGIIDSIEYVLDK